MTRCIPWLVAVLCFTATGADAQVTRVETIAKSDVEGGRSFGLAGPYEMVTATVHYAVDPRDPHNRAVADIDRAPRNGAGLVEFSADALILKPKDPARGSGSIVAGSVRSGFNTRFAQPSIVEPARFPFSDAEQRNPYTRATDGLLKRATAAGVLPKVIHLNTSNEYWTEWKAAAMVHTATDGSRDLALPDNVRLYTVVGAPHGPVAPFPPALPMEERAQHLSNPNSYHWVLRGLLVALDRWVREGTPPPASTYPRLADGSLVTRAALAFPGLPGVAPPAEVNGTFEVHSGPRFDDAISTSD
jgi:hypothetical protein